MGREMNPFGSNQLDSYFKAAMKKYEDDQRILALQNADRSRINATPQMMNIPDVEMESVGSRHSRSNIGDPLELGLEDLRRPLVAAAEAMPSGGFTTQRIRVSAIADLKEFTGRDRDEDRARSLLMVWHWCDEKTERDRGERRDLRSGAENTCSAEGGFESD